MYCFMCSVAMATSASLKISGSRWIQPDNSLGFSTQISEARADGLRLTYQSRKTTTPRTENVLDVDSRSNAFIDATCALA